MEDLKSYFYRNPNLVSLLNESSDSKNIVFIGLQQKQQNILLVDVYSITCLMYVKESYLVDLNTGKFIDKSRDFLYPEFSLGSYRAFYQEVLDM